MFASFLPATPYVGFYTGHACKYSVEPERVPARGELEEGFGLQGAAPYIHS